MLSILAHPENKLLSAAYRVMEDEDS